MFTFQEINKTNTDAVRKIRKKSISAFPQSTAFFTKI